MLFRSNPQALVEEMYRKARIEGLDLIPYISSARPPSGGRASTPAAAAPSPGGATATGPTLKHDTSSSSSSTPPLNDKLVKGIQKLCEALGKAEPEYATLTTQSAQHLLNTLTNEYKAARARSVTQ